MTEITHTISVDLEVDLENDIEVDDDGVLNILTIVYKEEDEDPHELRTPLDGIVSGFLEYWSDDLSREGYSEMFRTGNELRKIAERILRVAERHEDLVNGEGTYPKDFEDDDIVND